MASLSFQDSKGRRGFRFQFRDANKRKKSVWLGEISEHRAKEFKTHAEHLIMVRREQLPPDLRTLRWLEAEPEFRDKLATAGLCESVEQRRTREITLGDWVAEYIAERSDVSENTIKTYRKAQANLVDFFGSKKKLRSITKADAKRWRIWVATESNKRDKGRSSLAEATVRRRTGKAKQFFAEAVERGYIQKNPFDGLASTVGANEARQFFIPTEWIVQCMPYCPNTEWRTILALARFGALRCPSELSVLRWRDINLPEGRMMIDSPKTGLRICPIFAELRPYLEAAWDEAEDGAEFVVPSVKATTNLRTRFTTIIKNAGFTPWPKLIHNLRASRETELMAKHPAKDVASWLGNSVVIAMKHYAMATAESFQKAAGLDGGSIGGSITGSAGVVSSDDLATQKEENPAENEVLRTADDSGELPESSSSGRNRSRICDLLHVKQAL